MCCFLVLLIWQNIDWVCMKRENHLLIYWDKIFSMFKVAVSQIRFTFSGSSFYFDKESTNYTISLLFLNYILAFVCYPVARKGNIIEFKCIWKTVLFYVVTDFFIGLSINITVHIQLWGKLVSECTKNINTYILRRIQRKLWYF